jgi:hypothetical protein
VALYELKTYTLRVGAMGRGGKAPPGTRFPGASEGRAGQEARRLFPGRYRHDQPACAPMEVRRRRPPCALGVGLRKQGFCRGFRLEVPAAAHEAEGEAAPGRSMGAASVVARHRGGRSQTDCDPRPKPLVRGRCVRHLGGSDVGCHTIPIFSVRGVARRRDGQWQAGKRLEASAGRPPDWYPNQNARCGYQRPRSTK